MARPKKAKAVPAAMPPAICEALLLATVCMVGLPVEVQVRDEMQARLRSESMVSEGSGGSCGSACAHSGSTCTDAGDAGCGAVERRYWTTRCRPPWRTSGPRRPSSCCPRRPPSPAPPPGATATVAARSNNARTRTRRR